MMPTTICAEPRCPHPAVDRGRCQAHRRTTSQRGYGTPHQRARERLARTLPAPCAYGCGTIVARGTRWVAAHVEDGNPGAGWVVACYRCNERAKHGRLQPMVVV